MMRTWLLLGALLTTAVRAAMDFPQPITVNANATCGQAYFVKQTSEFQLFGTGDSPAADCSYTFRAEEVHTASCHPGLCYMFDTYATIDTNLVSLSVEAGTNMLTYTNESRLPMGPICVERQDNIKVMLSQQSGYKFRPDQPDYRFRLSIYHHCSEKGQVKNIKFEDVVDLLEGYHHDEEKTKRERETFIAGICVGFGMAFCFLIVFFVARCVIRNSPARGARSVSVSKEVKPKGKDIEMRAYKPVAKNRV